MVKGRIGETENRGNGERRGKAQAKHSSETWSTID